MEKNRNVWLVVGIAVVVAVVAVLLVTGGSDRGAPGAASAPAAGPSAPAPVSGEGGALGTNVTPEAVPVAVAIKNFAFSPAEVRVRAGATVTWTNEDGVGHTVTADGGSFGSALLARGQSFSHTFATPGTYPYSCSPHPNMRGTVVVE